MTSRSLRWPDDSDAVRPCASDEHDRSPPPNSSLQSLANRGQRSWPPRFRSIDGRSNRRSGPVEVEEPSRRKHVSRKKHHPYGHQCDGQARRESRESGKSRSIWRSKGTKL